MSLLASGITHGQTLALVFLCISLLIFLITDIYLVLFLHRKNTRLVQKQSKNEDEEETDGQVPPPTEKQ